jgi:hypothetical protein
MSSRVNQQGLDVLLEHAHHLNSVTFRDLDLTNDRSAALCSWQHLRWRGECNLRPFAYLPLHSVQTLTVYWAEIGEDHKFPGEDSLWLPVGSYGPDEDEGQHLESLMHQAASNLAACPALQGSGAPQELMLSWSCLVTANEAQPPDVPLSSGTRTALLQALAPVAATVHRLDIDMVDFELGQAELAALPQVLKDQITRLYLRACEVRGDFWPALLKALPLLRDLEISLGIGSVMGAVSESDLTVFCSHISRPFTLTLIDDGEEGGINVERLRGIAAFWSSPVEIKFL